MAPEEAEESDKDDVFAKFKIQSSTTSFMDRDLNLGKATETILGAAAIAQAYGDEPDERKRARETIWCVPRRIHVQFFNCVENTVVKRTRINIKFLYQSSTSLFIVICAQCHHCFIAIPAVCFYKRHLIRDIVSLISLHSKCKYTAAEFVRPLFVITWSENPRTLFRPVGRSIHFVLINPRDARYFYLYVHSFIPELLLLSSRSMDSGPDYPMTTTTNLTVTLMLVSDSDTSLTV